MTTNMHPSSNQPVVLSLWPDGAPGSEAWPHTEQEQDDFPPFGIRIVRNIVQPTLIAYLPAPAIATGTAVIVCPGGAFHFLAIDHEGHDVARWFNARGIAAFVLKYRVIPTAADPSAFAQELQDRFSGGSAAWAPLMGMIVPLAVADAKQAMKMVRQRAGEWGIAPDRLGIMGFSAGGRVTVGVALDTEPATRPNFAAPIYSPMRDAIAVPAEAPPLFLALTTDDNVAVESSLNLYTAWRQAGKQVELHSYAEGGHGFGMRRQGLPVDQWIERFHEWLKRLTDE